MRSRMTNLGPRSAVGSVLALLAIHFCFGQQEKPASQHPPSQSPTPRRSREYEDSRRNRRPQDRGEPGGLLGKQLSTFQTDVPGHPYNIVLVRPTPTSITVSVVTNAKIDDEGYIEYAEEKYKDDVRTFSKRTPTQTLKPGEPANIELKNLKPDTAYAYRWRFRFPHGKPSEFDESPVYRFHTPRGPGGDFTFTIQADSHLDYNVDPAVYEQTLANALADRPDFHIDLGDTFMVDKRHGFRDAQPQYAAQRYYFGLLCHSAPLFMVLGNHDGEAGYAARGEDNMAAWSFSQRTRNFPAPMVENLSAAKAMYTGRTTMEAGRGANYYEFTWGDAQFIVLDPFWATTDRPRGGGGRSGERGGRRDEERKPDDKPHEARGKSADTENTDDNWSRTLGREQYDWLTRTLESSKSRYKFMFIHHLVGGLGKAARGGMESSVYFEWGGKNADGSPGFAEHRKGWAMPIHDLLVKHHVSAVFHGHDHLYVRAERDGVIYQCVPQPGNPQGGTRSATEYGYESGKIFGSPGHLRVRVSKDKAVVDFVRSATSKEPPGGSSTNGREVHSYQIAGEKNDRQ